MKVNELRIGNLYDQFGNIEEVSWCTIKDMEKAPTSQLWCKPIYITKEWLLKLGFEKVRGMSINWILNEETLLKVKWTSYRFYIRYHSGAVEIRTGDFNGSHCILLARYVHQIQNLYSAMSGEELKIDYGKDNHQ